VKIIARNSLFITVLCHSVLPLSIKGNRGKVGRRDKTMKGDRVSWGKLYKRILKG
jgi:hypothetical protein